MTNLVLNWIISFVSLFVIGYLINYYDNPIEFLQGAPLIGMLLYIPLTGISASIGFFSVLMVKKIFNKNKINNLLFLAGSSVVSIATLIPIMYYWCPICMA